MEQYKKNIEIYYKAEKEFHSLPNDIKHEFEFLLRELRKEGKLKLPNGKKLKGYNRYEVRIIGVEHWRAFYTYSKEIILLLGFLHKKSQKTPMKVISKLLKRALSYEKKMDTNSRSI